MKKKILLVFLTVTLLFTLMVSAFSVSTSAISKEYLQATDIYTITIDIADDGSTVNQHFYATSSINNLLYFSGVANYHEFSTSTNNTLRSIVDGARDSETDKLLYSVRVKSKNYSFKEYGYFDISYTTKDSRYSITNGSYISLNTVFKSSIAKGNTSYSGASIQVQISTKNNDTSVNPYIFEREDGTRYYEVSLAIYQVPETVSSVNGLKDKIENLEANNSTLAEENNNLLKSLTPVYMSKELTRLFDTGDKKDFRLLSNKYHSGNSFSHKTISNQDVLTLPQLGGGTSFLETYDLNASLTEALKSEADRFSAVIYLYNYETEKYEALILHALNSNTLGQTTTFNTSGVNGSIVFSDELFYYTEDDISANPAQWGISTSINISDPSTSPYRLNGASLKVKIAIVDYEASTSLSKEMQMLIEKNVEVEAQNASYARDLSNTTFMGSLFYGLASGFAEFLSLIFGISFMGMSVGNLVAVAIIGFIVFFIIKQIRG